MYIIYTGTKKNKSSIRWHPVNPLGQQYLQEIYTVHYASEKQTNCEFSFKMLIPADILTCDSESAFKRLLKTHLFNNCFNVT